jgi:hypothetical protein
MRLYHFQKNKVINFIDIPKSEVLAPQGYLVTTPLRTITDIAEEGKLLEYLIVQAIQDAFQKGLFFSKNFMKLPLVRP